MAKTKAVPKAKANDPLRDEFRQVLTENGILEDIINETILFPLYLKYPSFPKAIKLLSAVYGEAQGKKRVVVNGATLDPAFVCLMCQVAGLHDYRITDWKRRLKGVSPPEFVLLAVHSAKETLEKRVESA